MEAHTLTPEERFVEFQRQLGKPCTSLDDLDWDKIKTFLEKIHSLTQRVDFLELISKLPDNGVVNNTVVDPARHHRNTEAIRRPLHQERSSLLAQHFNLQRILRTAEHTSNHLEAIAYLRKELESYIDYHPTIRRGSYSPAEHTFVKTIESKIQLRKDLHAASSPAVSTPTTGQDAVTHANHLHEQVKGLVNGETPLDESSARLVIELADDAIKEFGNTNQERKIELRRWKAQAELILPPATIDELKKRAEGQLLKKTYPKNARRRTVLLAITALIVVLMGLLALRQTFIKKGDVADISPSPTPTPSQQPEPRPGISSAPILINGSLTSGTINGVVLDADNKPIVDAGVSMTNKNTKVSFFTQTAATGTFQFDVVQFGSYELSISHPHFVTVSQDITLQNEPALSLTVKLRKGLESSPLVGPRGRDPLHVHGSKDRSFTVK